MNGPDYNGPIPFGMKEIKISTQIAVVAMRIFVNGENDLDKARDLQKGFHMLPLSIFQEKGLKYEMPKTFSFPEFVPKSPENLRSFDRTRITLILFLDHLDKLAKVHRKVLSGRILKKRL